LGKKYVTEKLLTSLNCFQNA